MLDGEGLSNTRIVAADGGWEGIVGDMLSDPSLAAAIDIVGAHYPNSPPPADGVAGLNKSFWASEMRVGVAYVGSASKPVRTLPCSPSTGGT